ncbi:MAG: hypothetical protein OHK0022_07300 [Roseiflexaceae bacterium]
MYQQITGHERVVEALVWSGHTAHVHAYAAARLEGLVRNRVLLRLVELLCEARHLDEAATVAAAIPASETQARAGRPRRRAGARGLAGRREHQR